MRRVGLLALISFSFLFMAACGGVAKSPSGETVAIALTPTSATVAASGTQQFQAAITGTTNTSVTWSVDGVAGGSSAAGTISASGLYTAPAKAGTHTVKATSAADAKVSAAATVTVSAAGQSVAVAISPASASLPPGGSQQFQATVTGTTNSAVSWSVDGVAGGNATVGTISATGLYIAPAAAGSHTITAASVADASKSASAAVTVSVTTPVPTTSAVLTYKYDLSRTGLNAAETVLTPANVSSSFGKRFSYDLDGNVFAQPLYVPNLAINNGTHNVVFVATEHDSVYALDADSNQPPLWKRSFLDSAAGVTTLPTSIANDPGGRTALGPEVGITGTPVIDPTTGTLYVSAVTYENNQAVHRLHALDITTGAEKFGAPVVITATVKGTGIGNDGMGNITFYPLTQNQRAGLLLYNGVVFVAFGSYSDVEPYHGWIFAYDAQTLQQVGVYLASPTGEGASVWQGGAAPAVDSEGNIYVATADGTFNLDGGGLNSGDTLIKLRFGNGAFSVLDWFTPYNQNCLNRHDLDLGSGGPALLPDSFSTRQMLVVGSKEGRLYVVDRNAMGHFRSDADTQIIDWELINDVACDLTTGSAPSDATTRRIYSTPGFFNGAVYVAPANGPIERYTIDMNGQLTLTSKSGVSLQSRGAVPVVSANGLSNGILWTAEFATDTHGTILRAFDAADISKQLYASTSTADSIGRGVVFTLPVVINGKVYVASQKKLTVFGLK